MKKKLKKPITIMVALMLSFSFTNCQKEEDTISYETTSILSAKKWFKAYEVKSDNYALFQNLDYNWNDAEIKNSLDGTPTIVVPVNELKKSQTENWEQKLYIYKLGVNTYEAFIFEIYPENEKNTLNDGNFNGYISVWDLKTGFVKAAKFENNLVVKNGSVMLYTQNKTSTNKAPSLPGCPAGVNCDEGGIGGDNTPTPLREVVVTNNYQNSNYLVFGTSGGLESGAIIGATTDSYTNHSSGIGNVNGSPIPGTNTDPCDKIKTQMANANFKAKINALKSKTKELSEVGYGQKKDETFVDFDKTADPNSLNPAPANYIGSMHTHIDPYPSGRFKSDGTPIMIKPIAVFSPADVVQFLMLLNSTKTNKIPQADIYSVMVSSSITYELKFNGNIADVKTNFNVLELNDKYLQSIKENNGDKELGFLKFLEESIGVKGIELYEINNGISIKKSLDANKNVIQTPC